MIMPLSFLRYGAVAAALCTGLAVVSCQSPGKTSETTMTITHSPFGTVDGQPVDLYTLSNSSGMTVKITNYGGIITHLNVPDKDGKSGDVVLGFDSLSGYLQPKVPYFGALVGRYGNRIAKGTFTLDGKQYHLPINNGPNALHGGLKGFDKKVWKAEEVKTDSTVALKLHFTSPDGDEGYPGTLNVTVTYTLSADNALRLDYEATTDKPTVVNLTNHTYFNLAGGERDVLDHVVQLKAGRILPVDATLIPTGKYLDVKGGAFDFLEPKAIGTAINDTTDEQIRNGGGYDHCFVFDDAGNQLKAVAKVTEPTTGRVLEMETTEPATQFYTGNFLDGNLTGKTGKPYTKRFGFCLETEHYPDSPNQPSFPTTELRPGQTYKSSTVYRFSVTK